MGFFKKKEKERLMFEISMETREIEDTKANLEYDKNYEFILSAFTAVIYLRYFSIMIDVIERSIDEAIKQNDVRSLRDYKKQYPGIEWTESTESKRPSISSFESTYDELMEELYKKRQSDPSAYLEIIGDDELISRIKQILRQNQLPQTLNDICVALGLFESSSYDYESKRSCIEEVMNKMDLNGVIRWKMIGGEEYACLPKDVDEMAEWKIEGDARRYDYTPFIPEVMDYIVSCGSNSEEGLAQFIEKQHPELLSKNRYRGD